MKGLPKLSLFADVGPFEERASHCMLRSLARAVRGPRVSLGALATTKLTSNSPPPATAPTPTVGKEASLPAALARARARAQQAGGVEVPSTPQTMAANKVPVKGPAGTTAAPSAWQKNKSTAKDPAGGAAGATAAWWIPGASMKTKIVHMNPQMAVATNPSPSPSWGGTAQRPKEARAVMADFFRLPRGWLKWELFKCRLLSVTLSAVLGGDVSPWH